MRTDNPWVIAIGVLAALVTIGGYFQPRFGHKTESKSPILSPEASDTETLKIQVTDTERNPLGNVNVMVVSDRTQSKLTGSNGYLEFPVALKSAEVSITLSKDGYETISNESITINKNNVEKFFLKKKK